MRVLLISFSFPPAGGVGVLRALSLAKYLPASGIQIDVLTARNAPSIKRDFSLAQQVPAGVIIHRCWTLDLPFGLRKTIKRAVAASKSTSTSSLASDLAAPRKPGFLQRVIGGLLLPDPQVGWLPFALPAAARIIRRHEIDLVLVTVPPFSSVRLVTKLREIFPSLPIVLDFRDEWLTSTLHLVSFSHSLRAQCVARKAEAEAVRDATAVVSVTRAADRVLKARYPAEVPTKFHLIQNGFETLPPFIPNIFPAEDKRVVLTFIGSVYGSSNPSTLIEAVGLLPPAIRSRLLIRFVGHIETPALRQGLASLGDTVDLRGFLPQAEALQAIAASHYLLLISHDPINVAAKFYDYLGSGKPILAAICPDGEIREILEDTEAGIWADVNDVCAICQMLKSAVGEVDVAQASFRPRRDRIAAYHRMQLTRRYAELLQTLSGGITSQGIKS